VMLCVLFSAYFTTLSVYCQYSIIILSIGCQYNVEEVSVRRMLVDCQYSAGSVSIMSVHCQSRCIITL
jgi:hypothetical protein